MTRRERRVSLLDNWANRAYQNKLFMVYDRPMAKRVALYLRVSTKNGQTVDNQRQALTEAIGRRKGWVIVDEFADKGVSGAKGRDKRPEFDRLGRSLQDLVGFLGELNAARCDLYLEKQAVDTTTPAGRALFQMLGVFAEFERTIIQERIHAGLARAREKGTKSGKPIGRARIDVTKEAAIRAALANGKGILKTARECKTGTSVVQRIKAEMARADSAGA